jgi:Family of unknown function (DUF5681)
MVLRVRRTLIHIKRCSICALQRRPCHQCRSRHRLRHKTRRHHNEFRAAAKRVSQAPVGGADTGSEEDAPADHGGAGTERGLDPPATGGADTGLEDWGWDPRTTSGAETERGEDTQPSVGKGGQAPRGRPFQKGMSGNPAGRPQGSRNRMNYMAETIVEANLERLVSTAIHLVH